MLLPDRKHIVLAVSNGYTNRGGALRLSGGFKSPVKLVIGHLYGFDRTNGKKLWTKKLDALGLALDTPADSPVLALVTSYFGKTIIRGRSSLRVSGTQLAFIDKRTGRVVHKQTKRYTQTSRYAGNRYRMRVMPQSKVVKFESQMGNADFTLTGTAYARDDKEPSLNLLPDAKHSTSTPGR